ncbi:MAG: DUF1002 domain-containing protein [Eubacterium sp.]|nr:DUF1002 domain-containing protein [Eubacterium sp.]
MKKIITKIVAAAMCGCMAFSIVPSVPVWADSSRIITLGADLSDDEKETVLEFFGLDEDDLDDMEVLTITNDMEHDLLDGIVANSVIGSRTYSCAYIEPNDSDTINVKTANLTYVTSSAIYNALQTAGVEGCDVIVTAPFEVSGTGALTGIFEAYDMTGDALDEDKEELATEELIVTSDLEEEYGEEAAEMLTAVKQDIASESDELSEDEIQEIIEEKAEEYNITLSEDDIEKVSSIMDSIQDMDYDVDSFSQQASEIIDSASEVVQSEGFQSFFSGIINWFKKLFGMAVDTYEENGGDTSIFDEIDTSVFDFDN